MKLRISSFAVFFMFIGCNETNVEPTLDGLILTVDKTSYSINEPIISLLSNKSNSSAYLVHCNFDFTPEIEKKEINSWIHYSAPICPAIYLSGITEFEAGKENKDTIAINESGIYRLKFAYCFSNKDLDRSLYSEEFKVE